jgi:hypothetical protein
MTLEIYQPKVMKRLFRSGSWRGIKVYEMLARPGSHGFRPVCGDTLEFWFETKQDLEKFIARLASWARWEELEE